MSGTDPHALRALIAVMRHHAESYESQAEGRSADDFEFLMDLSGLVTAWADALAEALKGRPAPPPESPVLAFQSWLNRYVADSRPLTLGEYFIAQAAFVAAHPGQGSVSECMAGCDAPPPQVGSKLEDPLQELADLEAEMRTYVCWGQPKVSVWLDRLTVIREALT